MTLKDMCEAIVKADFLRNKAGTALTAEEIFNYSPTGELYMVFVWYEQAIKLLELKEYLVTIMHKHCAPDASCRSMEIFNL